MITWTGKFGVTTTVYGVESASLWPSFGMSIGRMMRACSPSWTQWRLLLIAWLFALVLATDASAQQFGPAAGFEKARQGGTILVYPEPALFRVTWNATEKWNSLAERWLFWVIDDPVYADVVVRRGDVTYVSCSPFMTVAYERCYVSVLEGQEAWLPHELGHVLGFADSVYAGWYGAPGYVNPSVCDDEAHPAYSGYAGVMSYCAPLELWFGDDDRAMLRSAGY